MKLRTVFYIAAALLITNLPNYAVADPLPKTHHDTIRITPKRTNNDQQNNNELIMSYLQNVAQRDCGLAFAMRNNGCRPGVLKKYHVGQKLLEKDIKELPGDLSAKLKPVPGYKYVQIDDDVALISESNLDIRDIISLTKRR